MGWEARYRALPRHPRTAAAFADGHAEARPVAELTEPAWGGADCLYDNQP
jgi:prepilin-type processing-associated H-X9-DG protein